MRSSNVFTLLGSYKGDQGVTKKYIVVLVISILGLDPPTMDRYSMGPLVCYDICCCPDNTTKLLVTRMLIT
jgi:hypothetical protein